MTVRGDTYCGIYCGACSVAGHGETGRQDGFVACMRGVPGEEIACKGCKSGSVYAGCRVCGFRDCAVAKGVAHCVECAEFPCRSYRSWQSWAMILPHISESLPGLRAIKRDGARAWLEAQKDRWSCPGCGAPFTWYEARCDRCGRDLSPDAFRMSGLRRLACRFVLPRVYRKGKAASGR